MTKNAKVRKSDKIEKIKKHQNWQNTKSVKVEKVTKLKSTKNDQKSVKKWPPLKNPKMSLKWAKSTLCEIRAAWLGTFWVPGGTTGPGFKAEKWPPHS